MKSSTLTMNEENLKEFMVFGMDMFVLSYLNIEI